MTTDNPYGLRILPYAIRYRTSIEQTDTSIFLPGEPATDSNCHWYVLVLSPEQRLQFTSALLAGFDLLYPDDMVRLFAIWLQTTEYPDMFPDNVIGECEMPTICELVNDCLTDNPETINIIQNITNNAIDARLFGQSWNDRVFDNTVNTDCGYDALWGSSSYLVDYLHQVNLDFFADFEVATNTVEFMTDVIGNLTGIDETGIDAIWGWLSFVQDNIAENYAAQADTSYLESLKCEIFCYGKDNDCEVTPGNLFDLFKSRLSSSLDITDILENLLSFLVAGSWSGSQIADFMFFAQLGFRSMLGRFLAGKAYIDVNLRWELGANDGSDDWSLLCTSCAWSQDYLGGDGNFGTGWTYTYGTYNAGLDLVDCTNSSSTTCTSTVEYTFDETVEITSISMDYQVVNTGGSSTRTQAVVIFDDTNTIQAIESASVVRADSTLSLSGDYTVQPGWRIKLQANVQVVAGQSNTAQIKRARIVGRGTNPFV